MKLLIAMLTIYDVILTIILLCKIEINSFDGKIKEEDENDPLYGINTFEELKDSIMEGFRRELDKRGGDEWKIFK